MDHAVLANISDISTARSIAMNTGEFSVVVKQEVLQILEENDNNFLESTISGLQILLERELVSNEEFDKLREIVSMFVDSLRGNTDGEDTYFFIKEAYGQMCKNSDSSPASLAIGSVLYSSFKFERTNSVKITPESTGAGAVTGAVVGAGMGYLAGGPLGAAIGAAVGAVAGAAVGACNESGN